MSETKKSKPREITLPPSDYQPRRAELREGFGMPGSARRSFGGRSSVQSRCAGKARTVSRLGPRRQAVKGKCDYSL